MKKTASLSVIFACFGLVGCQTDEPAGGPLAAEVQSVNATSALQNINERGLACWIKSGDKEFKTLALVPELDTRAGTPRILVVERGKAQGLPKLVITASGNPVAISTFGPLVSAPVSNRINADILAWTSGRKSCA